MAGFRFGLVLLLALALAPVGYTQNINAVPTPLSPVPSLQSRAENAVNKVYSLADLGDDPNLCKWVAETIPQMIKGGNWNGQNLCYYAPAKVLAIHQTPAVHAEVEEFLASMRKSVASRTKHDPQVMRAQFNPEPVRPVEPGSASQPYPVPAPMQAPKHLFHFIIRYEGAGIIDSNVTKFAQALSSASKASEGLSTTNAPVPVPPVPPSPFAPAAYFPPYPNASSFGSRIMPMADAPAGPPMPPLPPLETGY